MKNKNKNKNWYKVAQSSSLDLSQMKTDTISSIRKYQASKKSQDKNEAQTKIAMYQNSAVDAGDNGHIKTAGLLTERLYQAMAGKISAKAMKEQAVMKQAKLRDWVLPGAVGVAGLMGAGYAKGDFYDGSTSGKAVTPTSANDIDYDQSKLSPQTKAKIQSVKKLHNDADSTNNKAFIQNKIKFLQQQKRVRNNTINAVKVKIQQQTKRGNLDGAMAYKNYIQKSLLPEIKSIDNQLGQLKGQISVQPSSDFKKIIGRWNDRNMFIIEFLDNGFVIQYDKDGKIVGKSKWVSKDGSISAQINGAKMYWSQGENGSLKQFVNGKQISNIIKLNK